MSLNVIKPLDSNMRWVSLVLSLLNEKWMSETWSKSQSSWLSLSMSYCGFFHLLGHFIWFFCPQLYLLLFSHLGFPQNSSLKWPEVQLHCQTLKVSLQSCTERETSAISFLTLLIQRQHYTNVREKLFLGLFPWNCIILKQLDQSN